MRRKTFSFEQAHALQAEAKDLMNGREFEVDSLAVPTLVRDSDCSAYDCEFIALADRLGTRHVTADKKLLRSFPGHAVALKA